ncbi:hypothetical protein H312_02965 [Anncaliia algerae PRA339]|uniref:Uncharacterized protein n=1 Tax=Anncaliia algerae PRA339 TaxID=1288291 RepID=A0A059EY30_9MICR|nr:hypothetical protein H312_02965 [Anncaliia algerae PRA339]
MILACFLHLIYSTIPQNEPHFETNGDQINHNDLEGNSATLIEFFKAHENSEGSPVTDAARKKIFLEMRNKNSSNNNSNFTIKYFLNSNTTDRTASDYSFPFRFFCSLDKDHPDDSMRDKYCVIICNSHEYNMLSENFLEGIKELDSNETEAFLRKLGSYGVEELEDGNKVEILNNPVYLYNQKYVINPKIQIDTSDGNKNEAFSDHTNNFMQKNIVYPDIQFDINDEKKSKALNDYGFYIIQKNVTSSEKQTDNCNEDEIIPFVTENIAQTPNNSIDSKFDGVDTNEQRGIIILEAKWLPKKSREDFDKNLRKLLSFVFEENSIKRYFDAFCDEVYNTLKDSVNLGEDILDITIKYDKNNPDENKRCIFFVKKSQYLKDFLRKKEADDIYLSQLSLIKDEEVKNAYKDLPLNEFKTIQSTPDIPYIDDSEFIPLEVESKSVKKILEEKKADENNLKEHGNKNTRKTKIKNKAALDLLSTSSSNSTSSAEDLSDIIPEMKSSYYDADVKENIRCDFQVEIDDKNQLSENEKIKPHYNPHHLKKHEFASLLSPDFRTISKKMNENHRETCLEEQSTNSCFDSSFESSCFGEYYINDKDSIPESQKFVELDTPPKRAYYVIKSDDDVNKGRNFEEAGIIGNNKVNDDKIGNYGNDDNYIESNGMRTKKSYNPDEYEIFLNSQPINANYSKNSAISMNVNDQLPCSNLSIGVSDTSDFIFSADYGDISHCDDINYSDDERNPLKAYKKFVDLSIKYAELDANIKITLSLLRNESYIIKTNILREKLDLLHEDTEELKKIGCSFYEYDYLTLRCLEFDADITYIENYYKEKSKSE